MQRNCSNIPLVNGVFVFASAFIATILEMEKTTSVTLAVLVLCFIATVCAEDTVACTTGSGCFPDGQIPDEVTSKDRTYYCCPQRNFTRNSDRLPDGTFNCTCVLDLALESKTVNKAQSTRGKGRMCSFKKDCQGVKSSSTINNRFKYCCYTDNRTNTVVENTTVTIFDGDKAEFILCRCSHLPVPTPDPKAYVVPPVQTYSSTGEVCSYDKNCQEKPFAKCHTEWPFKATFCCYGSRGIVTENDGKNFTRCTCTNEVYGGQCEARPVTIAESTTQCLTECSNRTAEDTCTDHSQAVRCCPHNMVVVATQSGGNFTSCTCKAQAKKSCGLECDTGCSNRIAEDTCTDNSQAMRCCPPGLAVVATQSGGNFASCTCEEQTQKSCGDACLTECGGKTESDTCTDDSQAVRCCPPGLAVVATQSGGNFASCVCKARVQRSCGKASSFATRFRGRLMDIISLMFAAFLLARI